MVRRLIDRFKAFGLPSLLLVVVVVTHFGYDPIAGFYDPSRQLAAAKAWHGVLRAIESCVLYGVVWYIFPWAPVVARYAISIVCAWGILESGQIAACRLQFPMDRPPPDTGMYSGLCDLLSGLPLYMITLLVALSIATIRNIKSESP